MKTAENISTSTQHHLPKTDQPFFHKEAGDRTFFSNAKSDVQKKPFFDYTQPVDSGIQRIQTKLTIGQPGDKYEAEADAMADQVVQKLSNPGVKKGANSELIQPKSGECRAEEEIQEKPEIQKKPIFESAGDHSEDENINRKASKDSSVANTSDLQSQLNSNKGGGQSLDKHTQSSMGSAFGADFVNVRVHTGNDAIQMSQNLGAQAFTYGSDIYFNEGKYDTNSNSGRHLLAHELTHTVQQGKANSILQRVPDHRELRSHESSARQFAEESGIPYAPGLQYSSSYSQWLIASSPDAIRATEVRNRVLSQLRRNGGTSFTTSIRTLNSHETILLRDDPLFWQEIKTAFRGRALWAIYSIIYFNNRIREPETRLFASFRSNNPRGFMDALALVLLEPRTPAFFLMLRTAIRQEFSRSPHLVSILQLINNRNNSRNVQHLNVSYNEVHYERNTTGNYQLQVFGLTGGVTVYQTRTELRVIVRIRFVDGSNPSRPFYRFPDATTHDRWQRAITRFWNNKFMLTNGVQNLRFVVVPMFYYEDVPVDKVVRVMDNTANACSRSGTPGRANAGCWFTTDEDHTIAHEFGHLLGASDEYRLPGSIAEIPASLRSRLSREDLAFSTVQGITGRAVPAQTGGQTMDSVMGDHDSDEVYPRHIMRLKRAINRMLPRHARFRIRRL